MASNYTANYGLSLWEPGDSFMRTEFNRDNEKIDTALGALGRGRTLQTAALAQSDNSIPIELDGVDWAEWQYVGVTLDIPENEITREYPYSCTLNRNTVKGHCSSGSSFLAFGPRPLMLVLLPLHDPSRMVRGIYLGVPSGVCFGECTFGELTLLGFSSSTPYPAGTTAVLWGVR